MDLAITLLIVALIIFWPKIRSTKYLAAFLGGVILLLILLILTPFIILSPLLIIVLIAALVLYIIAKRTNLE